MSAIRCISIAEQLRADRRGQITLQRHDKLAAEIPCRCVTVEGHCDERGTREEYNLALGARRANAVKEFLASLGVAASRADTISYGKGTSHLHGLQ